MFLQRTSKKRGLFASIATFLVIGLLFNVLPSVSEAHSQKATYYVKTETTRTSQGWDWRKNPETGESEKVWVVLSSTTTTTYSQYEAEVQHNHFTWKDAALLITAGASIIAAGATLLTGD